MNDCQLACSREDTSCPVSPLVGSDYNSPAICSKSARRCLFICLQGYIEVNDSWYLVFDRYKKKILRWRGCLVMFVSTYSRDLTWNICYLPWYNVGLVLLFRRKWRSKCRFWYVLVDPMYEPWHKWLSLPPCGPYLAISNILCKNMVSTKCNGQCSEKNIQEVRQTNTANRQCNTGNTQFKQQRERVIDSGLCG
jgi:hypothetical protein